jgi:hypothetical protein
MLAGPPILGESPCVYVPQQASDNTSFVRENRESFEIFQENFIE